MSKDRSRNPAEDDPWAALDELFGIPAGKEYTTHETPAADEPDAEDSAATSPVEESAAHPAPPAPVASSTPDLDEFGWPEDEDEEPAPVKSAAAAREEPRREEPRREEPRREVSPRDEDEPDDQPAAASRTDADAPKDPFWDALADWDVDDTSKPAASAPSVFEEEPPPPSRSSREGRGREPRRGSRDESRPRRESSRGETGRAETGRSETGRSETGRSESGRSESSRSESSRSETGRSEAGRSETGRTEGGRSGRGSRGDAPSRSETTRGEGRESSRSRGDAPRSGVTPEEPREAPRRESERSESRSERGGRGSRSRTPPVEKPRDEEPGFGSDILEDDTRRRRAEPPRREVEPEAEDVSETPGAAEEEGGRRRRRRRRRGGPRDEAETTIESTSRSDEDELNDEPVAEVDEDEAEDDEPAPAEGRSRGRRPYGRRRFERPDESDHVFEFIEDDEPKATQSVSDEEDDVDEDVEAMNYADVPSWEEAISYILNPQLVKLESAGTSTETKRTGEPKSTRHYGKRKP